MSETSLSTYVSAANIPLTDPERNRVIGGANPLPRFELYHYALSICSHKVRITLFEKGADWISHDISILPPKLENYHPDYVRLRLQGGKGHTLVDGYSGRSAITTEGFDPCVVPTMIDHEKSQVIVDSRVICEHINREWQNEIDLYPARLKQEIDRQISIVDTTPHVAVLYGAYPDGDFRPQMLQQNMPGAHDYKIMKLMESRSLAVGHPKLTAAFDAKIRKEAAAKHFIATAEMMRQATQEIVDVVAALDDHLSDGREWVCGERFTLADIHWATSLFRLQWLGMVFCWRGNHALNATARTHVADYAKRLFERQSVKDGLIHWPGNPPSEFVMEYYEQNITTGGERIQHTGELPLGSHGRDIREDSLTEAVLATMAGARTARAQTVLNAFTRHLHAFLEEVEPTEEEWEWGIEFLTKTGHLCKGGRQEFVLLSDVMGATARVDMINHRFPAGATENSVLGPFFVEDRPSFANGADISADVDGEPMLFSARVLDTSGRPVGGARVDIWHSDAAGAYDVMMPNRQDPAMRGLFRTDHEGRIWFTSILPTSYPIPDDGPVGKLLQAANRSIMRPGHVHVRIEAPGYQRLTSMLFINGDPYLDSDPVFGVKNSLVVDFVKKSGSRTPDGSKAPDPCYTVDYDFVLARKT